MDSKYDFKPKKRKRSETGNHEGSSEEDDLEESVRTISALLQSTEGNVAILQPRMLTVGVRVANINAQIIAHTMAEDGEEEEVDELVDELEGDGEEEERRGGRKCVREVVEVKGWDEGDDSDAFSVPLRPRKGQEEVTVYAGVAVDC